MDAWLLSWNKKRKIANRYREHGFTRRAITRFAWKYYGSTVQCEQRKNIERSHLNKGSSQIFSGGRKFHRYRLNEA